MLRFKKDRQRSYLVPVTVKLLERFDNSCHEVGATAHRFGNKDIRLLVIGELCEGFQ